MAKPQDRFSRRHQTNKEHFEAAAAYKAKHDAQARQRKERAELQTRRYPLQQIARLDKRFGVEKGARRERARLVSLVRRPLSISHRVLYWGGSRLRETALSTRR